MQNNKDQRRKKKLAERDRRSREHVLARKRRAEFPDFQFRTSEGDPAFVQLVKDAVRAFAFAELPKEYQELFKIMKTDGTLRVKQVIDCAMQMAVATNIDSEFTYVGDIRWIMCVGSAVLSKIPLALREQFLPRNSVIFKYEGNQIVVQFYSLVSHRSSQTGTTFYSSRREPILEVDGKDYVVSFSNEAIIKICKRIVPEWRDYGGMLGTFEFLDLCTNYELCTVRNRDGGRGPAFTFFSLCEPRSWLYRYVEEVFGLENLDPAKGRAFVRVGYCPLVIDGRFAIATTLLPPGFEKTPEYETFRKSGLPWIERDALQKLATREESTKHLMEQDDFRAIRWFHEHGVPQVIQTNREMFCKEI